MGFLGVEGGGFEEGGGYADHDAFGFGGGEFCGADWAAGAGFFAALGGGEGAAGVEGEGLGPGVEGGEIVFVGSGFGFHRLSSAALWLPLYVGGQSESRMAIAENVS